MTPSPESNGEVFPPRSEAAPPPMPDFQREVSRPNSRERGWNILATPGTYILLAINIAVFGWMILHGVSAKDPTTAQLVHYGATNAYLILIGQWWRLLTATFVHVGLIHIATNMWCLWNLGLLGEPLLGPVGLIAVYLVTGIAGNLLSLCFNVISATAFQSAQEPRARSSASPASSSSCSPTKSSPSRPSSSTASAARSSSSPC
jgi:rhomboid protease GluP